MKYIIPISIIALAVASCSSSQNNTNSADTISSSTTTTTNTIIAERDVPSAPVNGTQRFVHTEGKNKQDSTKVTLNLQGSTVTGQMNWTPFEKDSRKGTLKGTRNGDMVDATWTFMQEGMTDTLSLKFKLQNNELLQKPLKLNTITGRQQTDESADFTMSYQIMK